MSLGLKIVVFKAFLLFHFLHKCSCSKLDDHTLADKRMDAIFPEISPTGSPQPLLPLLAPSPLAPFTNTTVPKLSGLCTLNFTAAENLMSMTSIDCWAVFAPYLAHVICCPQYEATLTILIGQSSKTTNLLALNGSQAEHCLSDMDQILASQGAGDNLNQICTIRPPNLTEASCPVKDVSTFENTVESSKLLAACKKVDPVRECCEQVCQNAILEAATEIALKASDSLLSPNEQHIVMDHSARIDDCRNIVLRWLASKLDPSHAKKVLRGLSSCKVNKFCPLVFPDMKHVAKSCANGISNETECCSAMESYVSHLQKQSFVTNLQAVDCATSMGVRLRKLNISRNVYSLCHITLKDFSVQVESEVSGCLLPSLPSDATFDKFSGISFLCDLNDNIPAPWPLTDQFQTSLCNKNVKIPALPAATSDQSDRHGKDVISLALLPLLSVLMMLVF